MNIKPDTICELEAELILKSIIDNIRDTEYCVNTIASLIKNKKMTANKKQYFSINMDSAINAYGDRFTIGDIVEGPFLNIHAIGGFDVDDNGQIVALVPGPINIDELRPSIP